MHGHIKYIDGYINWRMFLMEASKQLEPRAKSATEGQDRSLFTKVVQSVDLLFEAYLEAVYIMARALQRNTPDVSHHDKANYLKTQLNDRLRGDTTVRTWSESEVALTMDNVNSDDSVNDYNKWTKDPIRREPLLTNRAMLPVDVHRLPDRRSRIDRGILTNRAANTKSAADYEDWLSAVKLENGAIPFPEVTYAQVATKKKQIAEKPFYDDDDLFFDDSSDGYDKEDTPVTNVINRYVAQNPPKLCAHTHTHTHTDVYWYKSDH